MSDWLPWLLGLATVLLALGVGTSAKSRRAGGGRPGRRPAGRPGSAPPRPRSAGKPNRTARTGSTVAQPRAGEIWWADVPYEDGTGSKVRPCLVLRSAGNAAEVLKITSRDKSDRADHVRIPTKAWDRDAEHDSFLDLTDPIRVAVTAFKDRAGVCDDQLWQAVRELHGLAR
ncbi:PemK-like, MazF-like toxin of type II toxin-antitoxin system [Micromonospora pattaloongensis]|uniref:PemK-like, MazF-like toxin of type II toxin-antitoxin system n=1 Tax=Micromonospora pattaloongensis TaxID=405436 RepID=A0A1H3KXX6_9ACTN|nr:type II toxin-antitoxin system PemK/MazF family toxin [Micromonospora pattaloongensis]SDY57097.1 PemK-like, MazF-like toxin of type II toxin-antitoxin system [Micromonospora pattaloongensis]